MAVFSSQKEAWLVTLPLWFLQGVVTDSFPFQLIRLKYSAKCLGIFNWLDFSINPGHMIIRDVNYGENNERGFLFSHLNYVLELGKKFVDKETTIIFGIASVSHFQTKIEYSQKVWTGLFVENLSGDTRTLPPGQNTTANDFNDRSRFIMIGDRCFGSPLPPRNSHLLPFRDWIPG